VPWGATLFDCGGAALPHVGARSLGTSEKNRLLTLRTNLATCCQNHPYNHFISYVVWRLGSLFEACSPNSDLGRAKKSLRTANLAILAQAVEAGA